jgi:predicted metalloprotease with PDZ domain
MVTIDPEALFAEAPEPIVYTVTMPTASTHFAEVTATFPTARQTSIDVMMPIWSPGFYRVENYATRVHELSVRTPEGIALAVTQPRKNRWQIQTRGAPSVVVSYRIFCNERSVTTNWVGADFAVLNGPATFVTLVEQTRRPHEVKLELPADWKRVMTGLETAPDGASNHYRADDFDTLADSPIIAGNPTVFEFEVEGSKHYLACVGDLSQWDGQRAARDVEKIVREHQRMWGFLPFKRYVFLMVFRQGGGGLEHKNSTLVTSGLGGMRTAGSYVRWLGLVSHEYFHAYNVKRLRPIELGPFDYEKEVYTPSLWVAEGLTTYYGDLIPCRAGLTDSTDFLSRLSSHIKQLQSSPGRFVQTLEQSSTQVWTSSFSGVGSSNKTVSYYVKGPIAGFLLDTRIRHATNGSKTLDDLMRLAYQRYSGEHGFTPEQFRQAAEEVAGVDLKEWFRDTLASTKELDYTEALDWFGLRFAPPAGQQAANTWKLEARRDATPAQKTHLKEWLGKATP